MKKELEEAVKTIKICKDELGEHYDNINPPYIFIDGEKINKEVTQKLLNMRHLEKCINESLKYSYSVININHNEKNE